MKNFIAMLGVVFALLNSTPSQAIVGLAADDDTTTILGIAFIDLSQIYVFEERGHYHHRRRRSHYHSTYTVVRVITYPAFMIAGLVLLDDESGRKNMSSDLSKELISSADLSNEEAEAYQENLPDINAVKDIISNKISMMEGSREEKVKAAGKLWTKYAEVLDQDAVQALIKMTNTIIEE
jgi:hypothetical protein